MLRCPSAPHLLLLAMLTAVEGQLLGRVEAAFTKAECEAIVSLFADMPRDDDVRTNPNLPLMELTPFSVARINRFDDGSKPAAMNLLHERLLTHLAPLLRAHLPAGAADSVAQFTQMIDFTLLHEFGEAHDHFDWHVDTKPRDGTGRTWNINVMLSQAGEDYGGGQLSVGNETQLLPGRGDAYAYAAGFPHRVSVLTGGRRHTLVVALTERRLEASTPGDADARRRTYWPAVEAAFASLTASGGSLADEPKVHILHGEHFEAEGRTDEAQAAFCRAYRAAADGVDYAEKFYESAVDSLQSQPPDLYAARSYLSMASCVRPEHSGAEAALEVVHDAIQMVQERDGPGPGLAKEEL